MEQLSGFRLVGAGHGRLQKRWLCSKQEAIYDGDGENNISMGHHQTHILLLAEHVYTAFCKGSRDKAKISL